MTIMEPSGADGTRLVKRELTFCTAAAAADGVPDAWVTTLQRAHRSVILGVGEAAGVLDTEASVDDEDASGVLVCDVQDIFVLPEAAVAKNFCRCFFCLWPV